jgi:hypothetical protein
VRKGQAYTQQLPTAAQRSPRDSRIQCGANEGRQLTRLPQDGPEYGQNIGRAVGTQAYQGSWRQRPIRRVNDSPTSSKWDTVSSSNSGCNV